MEKYTRVINETPPSIKKDFLFSLITKTESHTDRKANDKGWFRVLLEGL